MGASKSVLCTIGHDYELSFIAEPPSPKIFANHSSPDQANKDHVKFLDKVGAELVLCGAVRKWDGPGRPANISPLSVVDKPNQPGKYRLIWDGRHVDSFCTPEKFKLMTLHRSRRLIRRRDKCFSLDLKSGHHHVDIAKSHQTYMGFSWRDQDYVFASLPFGGNFVRALLPVHGFDSRPPPD